MEYSTRVPKSITHLSLSRCTLLSEPQHPPSLSLFSFSRGFLHSDDQPETSQEQHTQHQQTNTFRCSCCWNPSSDFRCYLNQQLHPTHLLSEVFVVAFCCLLETFALAELFLKLLKLILTGFQFLTQHLRLRSQRHELCLQSLIIQVRVRISLHIHSQSILSLKVDPKKLIVLRVIQTITHRFKWLLHKSSYVYGFIRKFF